MSSYRPAAVAGIFYPDDPTLLKQDISRYLADASPVALSGPLRALIVPHAGYVYSGQVAAQAYTLLPPLKNQFHRVVLLGPSHRVAFRGIASSVADSFRTPIGDVKIDQPTNQALIDKQWITGMDSAHRLEHSLEVQLPFLQCTLGDFGLIPLTVGDTSHHQVAQLINYFAEDAHTLIVISTDLSHFHDYQTANQIDRQTANEIESLDYECIDHQQACGATPLKGLLEVVQQRGWKVTSLKRCNSGDTAGDKMRVVGYGAWAIAGASN